jgi:endonuclease/exonuclease/phosphatase family metal-dependent hydrolase
MLSLVSVNIEGRMHLDRIRALVAKENPDVLCLQELCEPDLPGFAEAVEGTGYFMPMMHLAGTLRIAHGQGPVVLGVGIVSRYPILRHAIYYYHRASDATPEFDNGTAERKHATQNLGVLLVEIEKEGVRYCVATTHFTWTPDGEADDFQRADARKLIEVLDGEKEFVLCGDFNAPRGKETYALFAEHWTNTIPPEYRTSIDVALHRSGTVNPEDFADLMVDHLFTTPSYAAHDVRLQFGVSDHAAIVASIEKVGT